MPLTHGRTEKEEAPTETGDISSKLRNYEYEEHYYEVTEGKILECIGNQQDVK